MSQIEKTEANGDVKYNTAKLWQIALFPLNDAATNITMFLITFYAFYTQNVLGLAAVVVGAIASIMRISDGVIDPIIGFIMDKTNTKFGKFRPFMLAGNLIMFIGIFSIFRVPASLPTTQKYIFTTLAYAIYILGYTFQTTVTKGAQPCLTNDPKQRPTYVLFSSAYSSIVFSGGAFVLTTLMASKYTKNMIDPQLWKDASLVFMGFSLTCTILAIIALWSKDREEFFGLGGHSVKVKFRDYIDVIKHNTPIKMVMAAACIDKLASTSVRAGLTYFFANIILDTSLQGKFSLYTIVPSFIIISIAVNIARKNDAKRAFKTATIISIVLLITLIILTPMFAKPNSWGPGLIIVLCLMCVQQALLQVAGGMVMPMIADCSDYETYRSGRFIPGMMGALFAFVDKMISSLSTFIIGVAIALAGYGNVVIKPNTVMNSNFSIAVYCILFGLPLVGGIAGLIGMKFYKLDAAMMKKVRETIEKTKAEAANK
ncbi:MFS transporter [Clostridium chromiireducens]|uniref:Melibiose carrier protein n=1 Tax=Clostridium chromiireducens TaxID=225345 RepID=A0A1V4IR76_9CLOT|nr:MFS transporter [Clostridium chromiireducens]OPJ62521.1 melibiose carrier protein [Clostridium chromiireducens]